MCLSIPQRAHVMVGAMVALAMSCVSTPDVGPEPLRPLLQSRPVPDEAWQTRPSVERIEERTAELLRAPLDLDAAVRVALLNHPGLQANLRQMEAEGAQAFQGALLANPEAGVEVLFGGDHPKVESELSFDVGTLLTLSLRRKVARGEFEATRLEAAAAVIEHIHEVRVAFYEHVANRQRLNLDEHILEAVEASAEAARILHEAGNITDFELVSEEAQASEARQAIFRDRAVHSSSRRRLHVLMGLGPQETTWEVVERLPDPPEELPAPSDLIERATEESLSLARHRRQMELNRARLQATRREAWLSHLEVGVTSEYEEEQWKVGPSVRVALPVFDRQRYAVDALHAQELAIHHRLEAEYRRLQVEVRELEAQLRLAGEAAQQFRREVLPLRARVVDEAQRQFNAMELGVFELLQVRREQMRAGRDYVDALRDFWLIHARVEFLLAGGDTDPEPR